MSIGQMYAKSVQSSNLKDDAYHHDTDKLAAMALSKRLGSELFRVKYANDATSYPRLLEEWICIVRNKAIHRKWPVHVRASYIAKAALDYWLNPVCQVCTGRGFDSKINKSGEYEHDCKPCGGSGRKSVSGEANLLQFIIDMVEALDDMERISGGLAIKRLADAFDF
ncbi:hypothetical protein [Solimicrobium silvestre]|uniref:Uncharacterized protein n=1 Tax=Solimicrobium silvestre TaxID=2099400 RepID=A0A2S9GY83_9BURK|nr:hypothetical protein [Solimicrobium silvestre]PRC92660.1 hypothetical protein S2091_2715 [Solimicrobium silvestre]